MPGLRRPGRLRGRGRLLRPLGCQAGEGEQQRQLSLLLWQQGVAPGVRRGARLALLVLWRPGQLQGQGRLRLVGCQAGAGAQLRRLPLLLWQQLLGQVAALLQT